VGRPEGLVTGDRPVAVAILVGSLTHRVGGGGGAGRPPGPAWLWLCSLELRVSGPVPKRWTTALSCAAKPSAGDRGDHAEIPRPPWNNT
jgi:hypothetical protein